MDLQAAISFPFKDPEWIKKALVGSLVILLSIPLFFLGIPILIGWTVTIARDVAQKRDSSLPPWTHLSSYFPDGFKLWLASFVWLLPAMAGLLVFAIAPSAAEGTSSEDAVFLTTICALPFFFGFLLIASFSFPLQLATIAHTRSFASTVNPVAVIRIARQAPSAFFAAWVISIGVQYALPYVGSLLCLVGILPATLYLYAIWGHVAGQAIRRLPSPHLFPGDAPQG